MKKLLFLFLLFLITLSLNPVFAQRLRQSKNFVPSNIPQKIIKSLGEPLAVGTYTIGSGGIFSTIQEAFDKLSTDGIAGEVTLELIDDLYTAPATKLGFSLIGPIPGASKTNRVTIKPANNKNVTIEGSNNEFLLYLLNTSYVTFDGVNITGTTTLTIHAQKSASYEYNDALDFINNADHNIIQNITFIVEDNSRASGSGFWHTQTGSAPDSNLIQNNFVKKAGTSFFIVSASASLKGKGNILRGNKIGSETDSLCSFGIEVSRCENSIIENNIIQNLKSTLSGTDQLQVGILSEASANSIIRNNKIGNLRASSGFSASGIYLGTDSGVKGSENLVYNNMIFNINSTSTQNNSRVAGIEVWDQTNPKIYNNSVYLSGTGSQNVGSTALCIGGGNIGLEIKNNIFVNIRTESLFTASTMYSNNYNFLFDYNNLYCGQHNSNCLVRIGTTKYGTLKDWQATRKDLHSVTEMPNFISENDLHIDTSFSTNLEKRGIPIAGIDYDFDGDLRNVNLPDIGVDEFNGIIPTGALASGIYSVGTTGYFSTIQQAFDRLGNDGIAGSVTLELIDDLYTAPKDSFGFKLIGPITGAGENSRVTIQPAENKEVFIEGSGRNVIYFRNTSYITLEGARNRTTALTVHSITNTQFDENNAIGVYENSDNNEIKNLIVIAEDYKRISFGIIVSGGENPQSAPDSNIIMSNFIRKAGCAIILNKTVNNTIRWNEIGSDSDSLISYGIQSQLSLNTLIDGNYVQNIRFGIASECAGIDSYLDNGCIIRNNIVHNIDGKNARDGAFGIELSGDTGNPGMNNLVYNNMVSDIRSSSNRISGIQLWYVNNSKIYYNTVNLSGNGAGKVNNGSAPLYISHNCTNVEAKNNIFVNTRDESPYSASAIYDYNSSNLTSDYNQLYSNSSLVRISGINFISLTDWQASGKDLHSYNEMPNFIDPILHINSTIPTCLESHGTPIEGITLDFDGQTRNVTTPDIGADEFDGILVGVEEESILPMKFALEQNYPNPFNPTTKIKYAIPQNVKSEMSKVKIIVYDILGKEVKTLVNQNQKPGNYEVEFDARNLSSGIYFYNLQAGNFVETKKMVLIR